MERVSRFPVSKGENERFLKSFMTVSEIEYCFGKGDPQKHIAVRFAAKEAVIKALNRLSIRDISFRDIEITNDSWGTPLASIAPTGNLNIRVEISMSHSEDYAIAFAIAMGGE